MPYLGWTIVTMPTIPVAPASFEVTISDSCGMTISPFTGNETTYYFGSLPRTVSISMPPMPFNSTYAASWATFLQNLQGQNCVFQFTPAFVGTYANDFGLGILTSYWRLKGNSRKYSLNDMRFYGFQFEVIEAM